MPGRSKRKNEKRSPGRPPAASLGMLPRGLLMEARSLPGVALEAATGGRWAIRVDETRFNATAYRALAYR